MTQGSDTPVLDRLLAPLGREEFLARHWAQSAVALHGDPDRFAGLIGSDDIGRILQFMKPRPPQQILLVKGSRHCDTNWVNPDGTPRLDRVRAAWADGYSIVLNDMTRFCEPVAAFCAALMGELHHPVDANLYFTPPDTQAFDPHYDVMDVFVLQIEGRKAWSVWGAGFQDPMPDDHRAVDPARLPPLVWEGELVPGSVLYIPRGHVHAARATAEASLHLTVGVNVVTWLDLLTAAVATAKQDPRFRRSLPPAFFQGGAGLADTAAELGRDLARGLTLEAGLMGLAQRLMATQPPSPDLLLARVPEPTPDMRLRRRPGVLCHVGRHGGLAVLHYSGGTLAGPAKIEPALAHIATHLEWTPAGLPGTLGENERLVLARRLLRDLIVTQVEP